LTVSRLKHRLCHLERQATTRGARASVSDQSAIEREALLERYLDAAKDAERTRWELDTPEKEQERNAVYERLLAEARSRSDGKPVAIR
jgi:hypothetical protein